MEAKSLEEMPLAVSIKGLRKEYKPLVKLPFASPMRKVAIQHMDLRVPRGQCLAILGPNGAGKSTLLRIIATLVLPTQGEVKVEGIPIARADEIRRLIGWATGDERTFYWPLSGLANLHFFAALQNVKPNRIAERVKSVLAEVGLEEVASVAYRAYSSGMRQRLAIARALLHEPKVILLDEPTRSLDPESADGVRRLLNDRRHCGQTVIWVTHNPIEATQYCDRVVWIREGLIVSDLPAHDARAGQIPWKTEQ